MPSAVRYWQAAIKFLIGGVRTGLHGSKANTAYVTTGRIQDAIRTDVKSSAFALL